MLATLNHPNIVTILTAEKQENIFFIVMEFVPGETLEAIITREGALDVSRALDYTCQVGQRDGPCPPPGRAAPRSAAVERAGHGQRPAQGRRFRHVAVSRNRRARHHRDRQPAVHGARAVSRQGRVRLRHLLARRDDVPDADRRAALRHAVAGRPRSADARRIAHAAAHPESENPEVDQRHRPEGDGAGHSRQVPAGRRFARRRACRRAEPARDGRRGRWRKTMPPAKSRRTFSSGSRRAKRPRPVSAGTAGSRCTRDRTAARSAAKPNEIRSANCAKISTRSGQWHLRARARSG